LREGSAWQVEPHQALAWWNALLTHGVGRSPECRSTYRCDEDAANPKAFCLIRASPATVVGFARQP